MGALNQGAYVFARPLGGVGGTATRLRSVNTDTPSAVRDPQAIGDELVLFPSRNISDFISRNSIDAERPVIIAGLQFMPLTTAPGVQTSTFDSLFANRYLSRTASSWLKYIIIKDIDTRIASKTNATPRV